MSSSTSTNSPKFSRKVPFFNPVEAPKLLNVSKESVKTFSKEFEKYKKTLKEYADTLKIPYKSYGASIEIEALEAICDLQLKCTVAEVTEEKLQAWLNTFKEFDPIMDIEDFDGAVRKDLKMPGPPMDMKSRIFVLFAAHKKILKKLGWPILLTDYPKHLVRQIVAALRLETLRKKVERDLNFTKKDLAKDLIKQKQKRVLNGWTKNQKPLYDHSLKPRRWSSRKTPICKAILRIQHSYSMFSLSRESPYEVLPFSDPKKEGRLSKTSVQRQIQIRVELLQFNHTKQVEFFFFFFFFLFYSDHYFFLFLFCFRKTPA